MPSQEKINEKLHECDQEEEQESKKASTTLYETLPQDLAEVFEKPTFTRILGKALSKKLEVRYGTFRLIDAGTQKGNNRKQWKVEKSE